jgi:hypothetical protein
MEPVGFALEITLHKTEVVDVVAHCEMRSSWPRPRISPRLRS